MIMNRKEIMALIITRAMTPWMVLADGIDLVSYFLRTPCDNVMAAIPIALLLMAANYGLNFVVIGLPAQRIGSVSVQQMSRSLIWLTLWRQIADRIGAVLADSLTGLVTEILGLKGEGAWAAPLLGLNFIFSAISIAIIVFAFAIKSGISHCDTAFGFQQPLEFLQTPHGQWGCGSFDNAEMPKTPLT